MDQQYPSLKEIKALHLKYAASKKAFFIVFSHCQIIWEIAEQLITKNKLPVNKSLVKAGAFLHDIGVYTLVDKNAVFDDANYIKHGIEGYRILKKEGLPNEICRIAERHTGVGLTKQTIKKQKLPLPEKDYIAKTIEERLIMYADKFHSKPHKFNSFETYSKKANKFGPENVTKFIAFSKEFGKPELSSLSKKFNQTIS